MSSKNGARITLTPAGVAAKNSAPRDGPSLRVEFSGLGGSDGETHGNAAFRGRMIEAMPPAVRTVSEPRAGGAGLFSKQRLQAPGSRIERKVAASRRGPGLAKRRIAFAMGPRRSGTESGFPPAPPQPGGFAIWPARITSDLGTSWKT